MTFLQLCQKLAREVGASPAGNLPSIVTGQTGGLLQIVNWVAEAWNDIQLKEDWEWMRHGFTFETTIDDDTYPYSAISDATASAAITRFARWHLYDAESPPKIYLTSAGIGTQTDLSPVTWEYFSRLYRTGTQAPGHPAHIAVDPQKNLVIGPKPNAAFTITGEYYRSPQTLAVDGDTPEMPTRFHDLIFYKAMEKYAYYESAQEILARAEKGMGPLSFQLECDQVPVRGSQPLV